MGRAAVVGNDHPATKSCQAVYCILNILRDCPTGYVDPDGITWVNPRKRLDSIGKKFRVIRLNGLARSLNLVQK